MNPDSPAFPSGVAYDESTREVVVANDGMALRDYMAAQALAGVCANPSVEHPILEEHHERMAADCYKIADAMLDERQRAFRERMIEQERANNAMAMAALEKARQRDAH